MLSTSAYAINLLGVVNVDAGSNGVSVNVGNGAVTASVGSGGVSANVGSPSTGGSVASVSVGSGGVSADVGSGSGSGNGSVASVSIGSGGVNADVGQQSGGGSVASVSIGSGGVNADVGHQSGGGSVANVSIGGGGATATVGGNGHSGSGLTVGVLGNAGNGNVVSLPNVASVNLGTGTGTGGGGGTTLTTPRTPVLRSLFGSTTTTTNYTINSFGNRSSLLNNSRTRSNGGNIPIPAGLSAKLRMLMQIMQTRGWTAYLSGNAVCVPGFGVTNVGSWVNGKEMAKLQQMLQPYAQDIATLRAGMQNCRRGQGGDANGKASQAADLSRIIGVDMRKGKPVLLMM